MLAGSVESDEVGLLSRVELELLAAQAAALGLGNAHAFAGAQSDEVGFDFCVSSGGSRLEGAPVGVEVGELIGGCASAGA